MFGYVIVDKPNMLIKDYNEYRAYYCGLCKTLGKQYSNLTRLSLNYDITFLTILLHNYEKLSPEYEQGRCILHPVGVKKAILKNNRLQELVCNINILMAYYKLKDDINDEKALKYRLFMTYVKPKYLKARVKLKSLDESIAFYYEKLRCLEKNGNYSLDSLADCFANIMVEAGKAGTKNFDINLKDLCYNLGRWIYLIDAIDDLEGDFNKGKFNPLINKDLKVLDKDFILKAKSEIDGLLKIAIQRIRLAYDNMDITIAEGPLSNIIYLGLAKRTDNVINACGGKNESI